MEACYELLHVSVEGIARSSGSKEMLMGLLWARGHEGIPGVAVARNCQVRQLEGSTRGVCRKGLPRAMDPMDCQVQQL